MSVPAVHVKYGFIFDPNETWESSDKFEADLANLFTARGYQSIIVEPAEGQENIPVIMISKPEPQPDEPMEIKGKPEELKDG